MENINYLEWCHVIFESLSILINNYDKTKQIKWDIMKYYIYSKIILIYALNSGYSSIDQARELL